ncbi:MAG: hypothetical protein BRD57_05195 [Proteobacteria bacterium SW_6_67_9]|nr:MAG: hypothetical protein BRD57_05195 [Proteobacteria bacterium SW_6_67_9]
MSRLAQSIALLWAAAVLLPFTPATAQDDGAAQALERIVAVVNDSVVLTSELEAEVARMRRRVREQGNDLPPQDVLRERALDNLIDERLQLARAQRRGISVDDAAVNEALRNMASERGTDLAGLRERAEQGDRSFEQIRTDVRHRLIISRLRQRAVAADIQISAQEVDDFVARIERASDRQVQLRLRHILIELPDEPTPDELERARQRLGWRGQAELPSLFWDAVEDGEPGTITDPLRSGRGLHVLKLVDRRGGSTASVTEYQARQIVLPGDDDQARSRLATMRQRLRAGEADFAELARAESVHSETAQRGGRMGWIGPGDVPPAFLQALQGMQVGALSEPFRSPMGWHLVELTDQRERSDVEAYRRARARRTLYRRQVEQETQQWLRKLRENAFIERRLEP